MDQLCLTQAALKLTNLFVLVTNRCNLSCKHCYVSSSPNGEFGLTAQAIINSAIAFANAFGRQRLTLSGGEILSRQDILPHLQFLAEFHNIYLLTNGTLINKSIACQLRDLPVSFRFGIDGGTAHTHDFMRGSGAFERMIHGLSLLLQNGISSQRIEVFFTATPDNISEIPLLLELAEQYQIPRLIIEPVAVHGRAMEFWSKTLPLGKDTFRIEFQKTIDQLSHSPYANVWKWHPLREDFSTLTIYYDGRVFPYTPIDLLDEEYGLLGNIKNTSLSELLDLNEIKCRALLKAMRYLRSSGSTSGPFGFVRQNYSYI